MASTPDSSVYSDDSKDDHSGALLNHESSLDSEDDEAVLINGVEEADSDIKGNNQSAHIAAEDDSTITDDQDDTDSDGGASLLAYESSSEAMSDHGADNQSSSEDDATVTGDQVDTDDGDALLGDYESGDNEL